jgi:hypothetical protein
MSRFTRHFRFYHLWMRICNEGLTMATDVAVMRNAGRPRFYLYTLLIAAIILFAGFARSYFLKVFFDEPPLYPLLHLHGILLTGWFVLFGAQTWLIEARHIHLHRRLGMLGALLVAMILIVGASVVTINAKEGRLPPGGAGPVLLIVSYINFLMFGLFVGTAIYFRGRGETHKRLMLLATLNLLSAPINRIPLHFIRAGGAPAIFGVLDLFILGCVLYDTVRHRRLHPAFGWGALISILWPILAIALGRSETGHEFAAWMMR